MGFCCRGTPHFSLSRQGRFGLPMFPDDPLARLPDSRTPAGLGTLPWRCFRVAPANLTAKAPAICLVSGLNHRAFVLAVYASCRGFPTGYARLASGGGQPCRMGLVTH